MEFATNRGFEKLVEHESGQLLTTLLPIILPIIGGLIVSVKKWLNIKEKVKKIRILIGSVDDALNDDKITENEFRIIFRNYKDLVNL